MKSNELNANLKYENKKLTSKVNAKDFYYTFSRLNDEKTASPGKWIFQYIDKFYVKNDSIFTIELTNSFPPFLGLLATKYTSVVPFEAIDFYKENFKKKFFIL